MNILQWLHILGHCIKMSIEFMHEVCRLRFDERKIKTRVDSVWVSEKEGITRERERKIENISKT